MSISSSTCGSRKREYQQRGRGLRLALLVSLAALAGDALDVIPDSRGFELSKERWLDDINYYLNSDCPRFVENRLVEVIGDMTPIDHHYLGHNSGIGYDRKATIYCAAEPWQTLQFLPDGIQSDVQRSRIGEAKRYWRTATQEMLDCDIWLNDALLTEENINVVLAHEWGHCLGLRHENEEASVMNEVLSLITVPEPSIDDRAGLNVLYRVCTDETDEFNNHFMHRVPFDGNWYYAIMPAGGIWPNDVRSIGYSNC